MAELSEKDKAIKALEAAVRKAQRAGIEVKVVYVHRGDDNAVEYGRLGR